MSRFFIFRPSWSSSSSSFELIYFSDVLNFIMIFVRLICYTPITAEWHSRRSPSFSFECISNLPLRHILLNLNVRNVFNSSFPVFKLSNFILNVNQQFIAFPCGLFKRIVFPFYQVESFSIENFFINDFLYLQITLVFKIHPFAINLFNVNTLICSNKYFMNLWL